MPLPAEVFLSHATADRTFADRLAKVVRAHGVPAWYSRTNLIGSQQWHDEIGLALARCDAFVVVLSPAAVQSRWVKLEFMYAPTHRRYQDRIVPVVLKPCDTADLSWTLDGIQRVDFTAAFDQGCHDLLRVWELGYADPQKVRRSPGGVPAKARSRGGRGPSGKRGGR